MRMHSYCSIVMRMSSFLRSILVHRFYVFIELIENQLKRILHSWVNKCIRIYYFECTSPFYRQIAISNSTEPFLQMRLAFITVGRGHITFLAFFAFSVFVRARFYHISRKMSIIKSINLPLNWFVNSKLVVTTGTCLCMYICSMYVYICTSIHTYHWSNNN